MYKLVLLVLLMLSVPMSVVAAEPTPGAGPKAEPEAAADDEEIEEIEDIEVVEVTEASPASPAPVAKPELSPSEAAGRMHPALVHMPIAWLMLLVLIDFIGLALRREHWARVGKVVLVLTLLSFVPAAVSGFLNLSHKPDAWLAVDTALLHRNLMIATASLLSVAALLRLGLRARFAASPVKWLYLALVGVAALLVAYGGHLGGTLVYGEAYLPF